MLAESRPRGLRACAGACRVIVDERDVERQRRAARFVDRASTGRVPVLSHEVTVVFPRAADRGQRQTIDVIGPTNGIVSVYASLVHGRTPIALPIGDVWLDPTLTLHVATGPVDGQRNYSTSTTIPAWLPPGTTLVYQAVALTASNRFELSTPGFAVFR